MCAARGRDARAHAVTPMCAMHRHFHKSPRHDVNYVNKLYSIHRIIGNPVASITQRRKDNNNNKIRTEKLFHCALYSPPGVWLFYVFFRNNFARSPLSDGIKCRCTLDWLKKKLKTLRGLRTGSHNFNRCIILYAR